MVATAFDGDNVVFDPPKGMDNSTCDSISAFVGNYQDGTPVTITCWKLTQEELEEFKKTGRIWLAIFGHGMPPVALTGNSPFRQPDNNGTVEQQ